jgi:RNA polymerase sigma-70 factor (ECF subfamily)
MDFQQIYETFFPLVYAFLLKQCGNAHLAEELTQDTFYRALKSINSFKGDCRLETWLCQIAKNAYVSECRRRKKFSPLPERERADERAADLSEPLLTGESVMEILKAAHMLDETSKEVFLLRTCGEQDFAAIGNLFGKSASWARVTYHRAKLKVLRMIEEKEVKP